MHMCKASLRLAGSLSYGNVTLSNLCALGYWRTACEHKEELMHQQVEAHGKHVVIVNTLCA